MKKYIIISCLLTLALQWGCAGPRTQTVSVTEPMAISLPEYFPSIIEVRDAVFAGIYDAGWRPQDRAPGLIYAKKRISGETVTLEVDYSAASYFIKFTESTDEDYSKKSGNVPKSFASWAKKLHASIEEKIALIGTEKPLSEMKIFPRIAPGLPGEPILLEGEVDPRSTQSRSTKSGVQTRFEAADQATVTLTKEEDARAAKSIAPVIQEPTQKTEQDSAQKLEQEDTAPQAEQGLTHDTSEKATQSAMPVSPSVSTSAPAAANIPPATPTSEPVAPATGLTPLPTKVQPQGMENTPATAPVSQDRAPVAQEPKAEPPVIRATPVVLAVPNSSDSVKKVTSQPEEATAPRVEEESAPRVQTPESTPTINTSEPKLEEKKASPSSDASTQTSSGVVERDLPDSAQP